jgi:hypothetical protein
MAASSSIFSSEQARSLPWRALALFAALLVLLDQGVGRIVERLIYTTDSNWGPNQVARLINRKEPGIVFGDSRAGASFLSATSKTAREVFDRLDPWNQLRFLSRTYRVNGAIAPILVDWLFPSQRGRLTSEDGFMAHDGSLAGKPCRPGKALSPPFDAFKLALLKRLVDHAKAAKIKLVFVTAPLLVACGDDRRPLFARFAKLAAEWGVPYRSFVTAMRDPADFFDGNHINRRAALRYSNLVAGFLAERLKAR